MTPKAFFTVERDGDTEWFTGTDAARGPWSAHACHAGPVAGALARAVERAVPDKVLARLTVEMPRPVPVTGFRIDVNVDRNGRQVAGASAELYTREGKLAGVARSLHIAECEMGELPTAEVAPPVFPDGPSSAFPVTTELHDLPWLGTSVEVLYPPGQDAEPGPTTLWMRTPDIVAGETSSPFQTLCPLADSGNGISRNVEVGSLAFVNPDLTIVMHRPPRSRWIGSAAASFWAPNGVGAATATLFDRDGAVGMAAQTLLIRPA